MPTRGTRLVVGAWLAAGCTPPPGDLDPDVVAELARTPGDAVGYDWSGPYGTEITPIECDCPEELITGGCPFIALNPLATLVSVTQADGLLMIWREAQPYVGPVNADGTFSVGRVVRMDLFGNATMVWRIDGQLSEDELGTSFEGTVRGHLRGPAVFPAGSETIEERIDCREIVEITGYR